MRNCAIIVSTVVSSLGLVCYQSFAVRQSESRTVDVGEVVQPAEVKALAAAIESKLAKLESMPAPADLATAMPAAPNVRRDRFVTVPPSPAKGGKTRTASRAMSPSAKRVSKAPTAPKRGTESVLRKEGAALTRELSRNFYKKSDFGFNERVKRAAKGKRVSVQKK